MKITKILFSIALAFYLFSCTTPKDVTYFQNATNNEKVNVLNTFESRLKSNDIISIYVSAPDMDAVRPFNISQGLNIDFAEGGGGQSGGGQRPSEYLVDYEGNIEFPVLGKIKIAQLTRVQVQDLIKEKLKAYVNNPIVSVRLKNFKITVLGEVRRPGSYVISEDRVSVVEALGLAGDLTIQGKRQNIMVIRGEGESKVYYKLDLTSKNIFSSPGYYLAQNDVIYVEPNDTKIKSSKTSDISIGLVYSTVGVVLSVLTYLLAAQ